MPIKPLGPSPVKFDVEDTLSSRFEKLHGIDLSKYATAPFASSTDATPDQDDEKTVEELLAELGPEDQWSLDAGDANDIQNLLNEARTELAKEQPKDGSDQLKTLTTSTGLTMNSSQRSSSTDLPASSSSASKALAAEEDAEAAAYLQQVFDELNLEIASDVKGHCKEDHAGEDEDVSSIPAFDLPSPPTTLQPAQSLEDSDNSVIDLPSAPTSAPARKSHASKTKPRLPQFTDIEIDSWCIICSDDATVKCLGCDDDLYCAKCWREGHVGKDVGLEERSHRWSKYQRR